MIGCVPLVRHNSLKVERCFHFSEAEARTASSPEKSLTPDTRPEWLDDSFPRIARAERTLSFGSDRVIGSARDAVLASAHRASWKPPRL